MSEIAALDALGRDLGSALARELPRARRRRRAAFVAGLLALVVAVPAAGTATDWAGLAGGETPLPTQVEPELRVGLATGRDAGGPWRLEAYRARVSALDGRVGICIFASRAAGGTGRCLPAAGLGPLVDAGQDPLVRVVGGVIRDPVARVEVTLDRSEGRPARVVAVTPSAPPAAALRDRGIPDDLRPYAVALGFEEGPAVGVRALDGRGRTVAVSGRPASPHPSADARNSPVPAAEVP